MSLAVLAEDARAIREESRAGRGRVGADLVHEVEDAPRVERDLRLVDAVRHRPAPMEGNAAGLEPLLLREGADDVVLRVDHLQRDQVRAAELQRDRRGALAG